MSAAQTWRVVLAPRTPDGAAEERQLTVVWVERFGGTWTCGGHGYHRSPRRAAMMAAFTLDYDVAEILAPGELTRAEAVAAVTAERDEARAEVRRLTAALATVTTERDGLRADMRKVLAAAEALADIGAARAAVERATTEAHRDDLRAALAAARREGAEEMRRAAGQVCHDVYLEAPLGAVAACINEIRALPLDGDGGGS